MKIREELLPERRSYALDTPESGTGLLDCSMGENPYGFPDCVREAWRSFELERMCRYPHSRAIHDEVVRYWADYAFIEPGNVVPTDGSISALCLLCNILAKPGAEVVGFAPAFTGMVEYTRMMGMRYMGVTSAASDPRGDVDALLEAITRDTALVYIDNPNNPTGRYLPQPEIDRVLAKCEALGVYALIDEAYADFLPCEESSVLLGPKYKNIVIVRTFSKGFGLAGLRAGYIITAKELIRYIDKVSNPYMVSEPARVLSAAALSDRDFPASHSAEFASAKRALRSALGKGLSMRDTDDRVPICTLTHEDESIDLQALLLRHGVLTCSGREFEPLGQNSVRLRIPRREDVDRLLASVCAAAMD